MSDWKTLAAGALAAGTILSACSMPLGDAGKEWQVDTSAWWVPDDQTGCLDETTTCQQEAWTQRAFLSGGARSDVFTNGDTITLECKAPTPGAIRSATGVESEFWYYAHYENPARTNPDNEANPNNWWVPDIYVTRDVVAMASGVPTCPSDTPGINPPTD